MVEAGKSSSQTGELPSSGPFTDGTPIPDASLRPENPPIVDPISGLIPMEPISRRIASMSDSDLDEIERDLTTVNIGSDIVQLRLPHSSRGTAIGAGLAAGIIGFTGTAIVDNLNPQTTQAAIIRPVDENSASTKADNRKLVTGGDGGTICTPEFLAAHPNAIAQGDSNVGGEPSSNTSGATAEVSGSDTAAIDNLETGMENVIVTFLDSKGEVMQVSIEPCPPPVEVKEEFPTAPDEARKQFMSGELKISREKFFFNPGEQRLEDLNVTNDYKDKNDDVWMFLTAPLEVRKVGDDYIVLFGGYDKKNKPFTYIGCLEGNYDGKMAFEVLPRNWLDATNLGIGAIPQAIPEVSKKIEENLGDVFALFTYAKVFKVGVEHFDEGLARTYKYNKALFNYVFDRKKGRKPEKDPNLIGINTSLDSIDPSQVHKLPSIWGVLAQEALMQP